MSRGVGKFLNSSAILSPSKDSADKQRDQAQKKAAELISAYCDYLLKKGSKLMEQERLTLLRPALNISKFLSAKDMFLEKYRQNLSRRLIGNNYESIEFEKNVLNLEGMSDDKQTAMKLDSMLNDIQISGELSETFVRNAETPNYDFSIKILTSSRWPLKADKTSLQLPENLANIWQNVPQYYNQKHEGRVLTPLWKYSKVHIVPTHLNIPVKKGQYFTASTFQYTVLALFEDKNESIPWDAIVERTAQSNLQDKQAMMIHTEVIKATVSTLIHTNVILSEPSGVEPGPKNVIPAQLLTLFSSPDRSTSILTSSSRLKRSAKKSRPTIRSKKIARI